MKFNTIFKIAALSLIISLPVKAAYAESTTVQAGRWNAVFMSKGQKGSTSIDRIDGKSAGSNFFHVNTKPIPVTSGRHTFEIGSHFSSGGFFDGWYRGLTTISATLQKNHHYVFVGKVTGRSGITILLKDEKGNVVASSSNSRTFRSE